MRSRSSFLALVMLAAAAFSQSANDAQPVQPAELEAAVEKLAADPNLATSRKTRAPRWRADETPSDRDWSWLEWIGELFGWLMEVSRVLVWAVLGVLVALLAAYVVRIARNRSAGAAARLEDRPTHVRDLDIRPESLPDDVGAAAWSLWERGEHRSSLALLYRGLLSRLVHAYAAPIRSSSTEGDCLRLAREKLPPNLSAFAAEVIEVWLRAVYGGRDARAEEVRALCEQFTSRLPQPAAGEVR